MLRLTWQNLRANKIRFALTTVAVVLGVSFVVSSFVLGDGLRRTFNDLSAEIVAGTDLQVRPATDFGEAPPLDEGLVAVVADVDGVEQVGAFVESEGVQPIPADGEPIDSFGPPQLGFSWADTDSNPFTVLDGRAPATGNEFVIDADSAEQHGFAVGETYEIRAVGGTIDAELVGMVRFGESNDTLGAVLTLYPLETAQQLFDRVGQLDAVDISVEAGQSPSEVAANVSSVLPANTEVVDQTTLQDEQASEFTEIIDIIGNVLLGFALVALFVSIFIIANTFSIVLSQRVRELALLRAVGASGRQIMTSVIGEALAVGIVASAVGLAGGVAVAQGLRALMDAAGADLPGSPVLLLPRTIALAVFLGVGVTLAASIAPARRAARIAPVAALRDQSSVSESEGRSRIRLGSALVALAVLGGAWGLFGPMTGALALIAVLSVAAILLFVGITLVAPVVAGPFTALFARPLQRVAGVSGRLSAGNAGRSPRRTATTAAALMVGLALVAMALVVGESVKKQLNQTLEQGLVGEVLITPSVDEVPVPSTVLPALQDRSDIDAVSPVRYDAIRVGDDVKDIAGVDFDELPLLLNIDVREGEMDGASPRPLAIHSDVASDRSAAIGDSVVAELPDGGTTQFEVVAVYGDATGIGTNWVTDLDTFGELFSTDQDDFLVASVSDELTAEQVDVIIDELAVAHPQATVDSAASFMDRAAATVDAFLIVVNVLLGLAIVIALIGIANTLALSVYERTRELGLLRAVGMTRRQMRRMVRWESLLVALFGASIGAVVGIGLGAAVVAALPDAVTGVLAVPTVHILVLVAVATTAARLAAFFPARRAAKLDVLDAISA